MSNASLYYDAPVPTTTHATQASRQPFVPSNNLSSRPQSTSTQQNYSSNDPENYYNDSASTRSFMPNVDQHGQIHGGGKRPHRSSRTKEHQSSDEGSDHRAHNSHSHSHSRSKGHQSHSTQSLAQGIGGVPLGHSAAGGAGVIHGQTPLQHSHAQGQFITSSARRPSSTATYTGQQNFFNQQSAQGVRGGGTVSAGEFLPQLFREIQLLNQQSCILVQVLSVLQISEVAVVQVERTSLLSFYSRISNLILACLSFSVNRFLLQLWVSAFSPL